MHTFVKCHYVIDNYINIPLIGVTITTSDITAATATTLMTTTGNAAVVATAT